MFPIINEFQKTLEGIFAISKTAIRRIAGDHSRYDITAWYFHRDHPEYFDDTTNTDDWQSEVYEAARDLMRFDNLRTVYDIGCGSGYKLVHILGDYDTTGIDLPETISAVTQRYPTRKWISATFEAELPKADLVI